jgi:hypothetical protein
MEVAQRMAGRSERENCGLYDRRNDDVSVGKSREFRYEQA